MGLGLWQRAGRRDGEGFGQAKTCCPQAFQSVHDRKFLNSPEAACFPGHGRPVRAPESLHFQCWAQPLPGLLPAAWLPLCQRQQCSRLGQGAGAAGFPCLGRPALQLHALYRAPDGDFPPASWAFPSSLPEAGLAELCNGLYFVFRANIKIHWKIWRPFPGMGSMRDVYPMPPASWRRPGIGDPGIGPKGANIPESPFP